MINRIDRHFLRESRGSSSVNNLRAVVISPPIRAFKQCPEDDGRDHGTAVEITGKH